MRTFRAIHGPVRRHSELEINGHPSSMLRIGLDRIQHHQRHHNSNVITNFPATRIFVQAEFNQQRRALRAPTE